MKSLARIFHWLNHGSTATLTPLEEKILELVCNLLDEKLGTIMRRQIVGLDFLQRGKGGKIVAFSLGPRSQYDKQSFPYLPNLETSHLFAEIYAKETSKRPAICIYTNRGMLRSIEHRHQWPEDADLAAARVVIHH